MTTMADHDFPTDGELANRFETLGELVDPADVPALVLAGVEVWSYGYDSDDPEMFTTLDETDVSDWGPDAIEAWGPFRRSVTPHLGTRLG